MLLSKPFGEDKVVVLRWLSPPDPSKHQSSLALQQSHYMGLFLDGLRFSFANGHMVTCDAGSTFNDVCSVKLLDPEAMNPGLGSLNSRSA